MKIAVLDDEKIYRDKISEIIYKNDPFAAVDTFARAAELLHSNTAYELLLLDIEMPETDGITFVKNYASLFQDILFITSYDKYIFDSFLPNVRGYIVKDRMEDVLIPKICQIKNQRATIIQFHTDLGILPISSDHIQYFYTEDTFVYLVTFTKKYSLTYKSMKQLPIDYTHFFYASRSHLVQITNISELQKISTSIKMKNKDVIKVSRRNWKSLTEAFARSG